MTETDDFRADKGATGVWNVSLETGMELIERQHQALFDQMHILLDRSQVDRIPETLRFMAGYGAEHFRTEEYLHRRTNYPRAEEHFIMHSQFVATFTELQLEYDDSGHSLLILMKLVRFLLAWQEEHTLGQDQDFVDYFRRREPNHRT